MKKLASLIDYYDSLLNIIIAFMQAIYYNVFHYVARAKSKQIEKRQF